MRTALVLLAALAACSSYAAVRDLPATKPPAEGATFVAGRIGFAGTKVDATLLVKSEKGRQYLIRPEKATFLVPLPPGVYTIERFGAYEPIDDTLRFVVEPGSARYIGSFRAARDEHGFLRIVAANEFAHVEKTLAARYGEYLPLLEVHLIQSALEPLFGPDQELVIAVRRAANDSIPISIGIGFGFGYSYSSGSGYACRPSPQRGHGSYYRR